MILLTNYFKAPDIERMTEIDVCLDKNLSNPIIKRVVVFLEDGAKLEKLHHNLSVVSLNHRILYNGYFQYANSNYSNDVVVVANNDVYFDDTLDLVNKVNLNNVFIALGKGKDVDVNGKVVRPYCPTVDSQDCWMFRAPIRAFKSDWTQGVPGCDNRLVYEARAVGYKVINPILSINSYHLHASKVRYYNLSQFIGGPYDTCLASAI